MSDITTAKRLIALSPEGARLLGAGVYRDCSQARLNIAAQAALSDDQVCYTPEERRVIAEVIGEPGGARVELLQVRLTQAERVTIGTLAEAAGMTVSEYVRQRALEG